MGTTRYTVAHLAAEHHFLGWTAEELLRQHSDLAPAEVYAALAYFHDHHDAILAAIDATGRRWKPSGPRRPCRGPSCWIGALRGQPAGDSRGSIPCRIAFFSTFMYRWQLPTPCVVEASM